jgi:prepilin-type N-terminal cleavage/methylation domain-containing protein
MNLPSDRRVGMTLVELLVAVAILGLLAIAVLPSFATTTDRSRAREASRAVTSFIAQAQGRAIGQQTPVGFGIVKLGASQEDPAIDLVLAMVPEAYRGDTSTAAVSLTLPPPPPTPPPPPLIRMDLTFNPPTTNPAASHVGCETGDLIRFDGRGPWFEFLALPGPVYQCALRWDEPIDPLASQTRENTPWPALAPTTHAFEILRRPRRAGAAMSLGESRCIDVYWSWAGQTRLDVAEPVINVLFDTTGAVRQIVFGSSRMSPDGDILLLVGRIDRAGQDAVLPLPATASDDSIGANWQYADSNWISINPLSGACRTAPCDAAAARQPPPPGLSNDAQVLWSLRQSQTLIRSDAR